jgi:hypothetical protein
VYLGISLFIAQRCRYLSEAAIGSAGTTGKVGSKEKRGSITGGLACLIKSLRDFGSPISVSLSCYCKLNFQQMIRSVSLSPNDEQRHVTGR